MDTTIKNASYASIPMQPLNEDQKASSENTEGSVNISNGRCCVIGLGVVIIGGVALGLGLRLTGGKQLSASTSVSGLGNTQGFDTRGAPTRTVSSTPESFITRCISCPPNTEVTTPSTPWAPQTATSPARTYPQGTTPPTTSNNAPQQPSASTTIPHKPLASTKQSLSLSPSTTIVPTSSNPNSTSSNTPD